MDYKRILLIRTDRIGDVLLTTPAIEAVRERFPLAHIAMMVRPYAKDIVNGNPYIDEVIIYDKYREHKSFIKTFQFSGTLKKKNFDLAVIFHPTNRTHAIAYLAAIPRRIGYKYKFSGLLTDTVLYTKDQGLRHESDYVFDVLKPLGIINQKNKKLFMPVKPESESSVNLIMFSAGIAEHDKIVIMHPGASCDSKTWPAERFAQLADKLSDEFKAKIIITAGNEKRDMDCAKFMRDKMRASAVFLAGKLTISELASCIKKAVIFISNDSGPVHIACALGIPSIVIFGRAQKGLSPKRWGPIGEKDIVLHKDAGCAEKCLAHNCRKNFECLKAVSVDEVFKPASEILLSQGEKHEN